MILGGVHFVTLSETSDAYDDPYILVENTKYCGGEEHLFWDSDGFPVKFSSRDLELCGHLNFCKRRKLFFVSFYEMRYLEELIEENQKKKGELINV